MLEGAQSLTKISHLIHGYGLVREQQVGATTSQGTHRRCYADAREIFVGQDEEVLQGIKACWCHRADKVDVEQEILRDTDIGFSCVAQASILTTQDGRPRIDAVTNHALTSIRTDDVDKPCLVGNVVRDRPRPMLVIPPNIAGAVQRVQDGHLRHSMTEPTIPTMNITQRVDRV